MHKAFEVKGMTCQGCVVKVKEILESLPDVKSANVQLSFPQAYVTTEKDLDLAYANELFSRAGNYSIQEIETDEKTEQTENAPLLPDRSLQTYKPLILIVCYISGVSILTQYPFEAFSWLEWMRHFMAGFFLVFSFFKLLNIQGFAQSYAMYDLLAAKWKLWGYIYPFVELALGIAYFINFYPELTNWFTLIVLGFSSIGVIKSNLTKRKIKCACLGDVFNLPMSTVTIVEDLTMVAMAAAMLI